jgi:uncharacterized repeat protein (TIGR03803 family)
MRSAIFLAMLAMLPSTTHGQTFAILHSFSGSDGRNPGGYLTLSGSTLYGTTVNGGMNANGAINGTVFSINTDGTGFRSLMTFNNDTSPHDGLTLSGSTLYGTGGGPGPNGNGTLFSINTDGTGFRSLSPFNGTNVESPRGGPVLVGATLYGAAGGGPQGYGTLYSMNTDGTGLHTLFSFNGTNGQEPDCHLTLSGSTLYGTTFHGGINNPGGTVFSISTDGTGFRSLLSFGGGNDGNRPYSSLALSGSTLYGMTYYGGTSNHGTVFSMNTDGSGFRTLLSFNGTNGSRPIGELTLSGSTLYGTTTYGGTNDDGTVFSINTDGTGFRSILSFDDTTTGFDASGRLTLSGSTLYGTTVGGGPNGSGTVFSLGLTPIPEPSTLALLGAAAIGLLACAWRQRKWRTG